MKLWKKNNQLASAIKNCLFSVPLFNILFTLNSAKRLKLSHIHQPRFLFHSQILRVSRDSQFSPPSERCASDPLLETLEARETVDLILDVMFR